MERLRIFERRPVQAALGILMGATALSACGQYNYSGEGNEFSVTGVVLDAGDQSLKIDVEEVDYVNGWSKGWMDDMDGHRVHDNCDCHGTWTGRKQYGEVYDLDGEVIEPSEVAVGACVHMVGAIRTDSDGKTSHRRPVYETAQILVEC